MRRCGSPGWRASLRLLSLARCAAHVLFEVFALAARSFRREGKGYRGGRNLVRVRQHGAPCSLGRRVAIYGGLATRAGGQRRRLTPRDRVVGALSFAETHM